MIMFTFEFWDALANCWYSGSDIEKLALTIYRFYIFSKGSIYGQTLSLVIDGQTVEMSDYTLEKAYENGVKSYTLTLVK